MKMNLPGLHGGISQQTPNLRLPNQHTDATNVVFDVVDGVKTRWPLQHSAGYALGSAPTFLGSIKTTDGLTWTAFHTKGVSTGSIVFVPDDPTMDQYSLSAAGYIFDLSSNLKMYSILDTILLLNKNTTVTIKTDTDSRGLKSKALCYVPRVYEGNNYSVTMTLRATKTLGLMGGPYYFRAGDTIATVTYDGAIGVGESLATFMANLNNAFTTAHTFGKSEDAALTLSSIEAKGTLVKYNGAYYQCKTSHTTSTDDYPDTSAKWEVITTAGGTIPDWAPGAAVLSDADFLLCAPQIIIEVTSDFTISSYSSYVNLVNSLDTSGINRFVVYSKSFEDLPPTIASAGTAAETVFKLADGYYVYYDYDEAVYKETTAPTYSYYIDKTTMPVEITYNSTTHAWTLASVAAYETNGRLIGDSNSAPLPSFVGRKLNAVFFYRNRMCFLSENRVVMSRVGGYYNFFPETATEVLDSDPIDVFPAYKNYSPLLWAIPYSKNLVLIGPEKQYVLHSGFEALTPKTVAIDEATSYKVLPQIEPLMLETSILLWLDQGAYAGLLEYHLSEQEIATEGALLTDNVPRLIPSTITNSVYLQSEHMVIAYAQGAEIAYVYKFHKNEGGQRMQSAWTKFTWSDLDAITGIVASNESTLLLFLGNYLWIMGTDVDLLALPAMDILSSLSITGGTLDPGLIAVNRTTGKALLMDEDNVLETLPEATPVWIGYPIDWNLELSPLILRDDNGLPRSDVKSTIKNVQVDWTGGDFQIKTSGDGLPTRVTDVIPVSYESHLITPGASVSEVHPTRALVMAPSKRVKLELISSGFNHVKIHNVSYNLELRKDKG